MTKVMMKAEANDEFGYDIFFDCMNHAGSKDVCIMCSTLCNVLIAACERAKEGNVLTSDGHVQIILDNANGAFEGVFSSVMEVFKGVQEQFPEHCKVY